MIVRYESGANISSRIVSRGGSGNLAIQQIKPIMIMFL